MTEVGHNVVVTSPKHAWLGTSHEQEDPHVIAVLVGKELGDNSSTAEDAMERVKEDANAMDIIALFFEHGKKGWKEVSVEKLGTRPYTLNEVMAINYLYAIRPCESNEEQTAYLKEIGLAIDDQFVGC